MHVEKKDLLLACLAAAKGKSYEPVHIQKLIFLFQEKAPSLFDDKPFLFKAYDYGPFDSTIYHVLDELSVEGLVMSNKNYLGRYRTYQLSEIAHSQGEACLNKITEPFKTYLTELSEWVRSQSFASLVGAVYNEFPDMKKNSIFRT